TSATKKIGLKQLTDAILEAYESYTRKINQEELSKLVSQLPLLSPNFSRGDLRIYSIRQVKTKPPKFLVQVNKKELADDNIKRTLQRLIRESIDPFTGTPLHIDFKGREKR
ncbi:MAG: ribosome-associated GTPase EngA, partial [Pseudothermotoga sp.]